MIELNNCPLCNHDKKQTFLHTRDFFLTGELFDLDVCAHCGFIFTNPQPDNDQLYKYYKSKEYLSHTASNKSLIGLLYRLIRNRALRGKYKLLKTYKKEPSDLLDYGCGTGDFLKFCKDNGWKVSGIEPDTDARTMAINRNGPETFDSLETLLEHSKNRFDVITMWHVLEHIPDFKKVLSSLVNLLAEDGIIIIAVPNCKSKDALHYKEFWAAYDTPRHLYHFTRETMGRLLERINLVSDKIFPMRYDAYYVSLLSEKYKKNSFKYFNAIYNGLRSNLSAKKDLEYSSLIFVARKSK